MNKMKSKLERKKRITMREKNTKKKNMTTFWMHNKMKIC